MALVIHGGRICGFRLDITVPSGPWTRIHATVVAEDENRRRWLEREMARVVRTTCIQCGNEPPGWLIAELWCPSCHALLEDMGAI